MADWSTGHRFRFTPEFVMFAPFLRCGPATSADGDPATTEERTEAS